MNDQQCRDLLNHVKQQQFNYLLMDSYANVKLVDQGVWSKLSVLPPEKCYHIIYEILNDTHFKHTLHTIFSLLRTTDNCESGSFLCLTSAIDCVVNTQWWQADEVKGKPKHEHLEIRRDENFMWCADASHSAGKWLLDNIIFPVTWNNHANAVHTDLAALVPSSLLLNNLAQLQHTVHALLAEEYRIIPVCRTSSTTVESVKQLQNCKLPADTETKLLTDISVFSLSALLAAKIQAGLYNYYHASSNPPSPLPNRAAVMRQSCLYRLLISYRSDKPTNGIFSASFVLQQWTNKLSHLDRLRILRKLCIFPPDEPSSPRDGGDDKTKPKRPNSLNLKKYTNEAFYSRCKQAFLSFVALNSSHKISIQTELHEANVLSYGEYLCEFITLCALPRMSDAEWLSWSYDASKYLEGLWMDELSSDFDTPVETPPSTNGNHKKKKRNKKGNNRGDVPEKAPETKAADSVTASPRETAAPSPVSDGIPSRPSSATNVPGEQPSLRRHNKTPTLQVEITPDTANTEKPPLSPKRDPPNVLSTSPSNKEQAEKPRNKSPSPKVPVARYLTTELSNSAIAALESTDHLDEDEPAPTSSRRSTPRSSGSNSTAPGHPSPPIEKSTEKSSNPGVALLKAIQQPENEALSIMTSEQVRPSASSPANGMQVVQPVPTKTQTPKSTPAPPMTAMRMIQSSRSQPSGLKYTDVPISHAPTVSNLATHTLNTQPRNLTAPIPTSRSIDSANEERRSSNSTLTSITEERTSVTEEGRSRKTSIDERNSVASSITEYCSESNSNSDCSHSIYIDDDDASNHGHPRLRRTRTAPTGTPVYDSGGDRSVRSRNMPASRHSDRYISSAGDRLKRTPSERSGRSSGYRTPTTVDMFDPSYFDVEQYAKRTSDRFVKLTENLTQDIIDMACSLYNGAQTRRPWQMTAIERIKHIVSNIWPQATVDIFGSFGTGLSIPASDVDLVVSGVVNQIQWWSGNNPVSTMAILTQNLRSAAWVSSVRTIENTAMPVIKLVTSPALLSGNSSGDNRGTIRIDISFSNDTLASSQAKHQGIATRDFVSRLCAMNPSLLPMTLVLKQFLLEKGLHDPYTGGLTSYALTIMVASLLQPYALDPPSTHPNMGTLLLMFLRRYGPVFDTRKYAVIMSTSGPFIPLGPGLADAHVPRVGSPDYWQPADPVVVLDPLNSSNNVGRSCFGFRILQSEFHNSLTVIGDYYNKGLHLASDKQSALGAIFGSYHHDNVVKLTAHVWCPSDSVNKLNLKSPPKPNQKKQFLYDCYMMLDKFNEEELRQAKDLLSTIKKTSDS